MSDRPNVLIVEDDDTSALVLKSMIAQCLTPSVRRARNGAEALEMLAQEAADLVVSDWNMPQMSGADLLAKLRAQPQWSRIPFVMITARSDRDSVAQVVRLGASGYILKPFDKANVLNKLQQLLPGAPAPRDGTGDDQGDGWEQRILARLKRGQVELPTLPQVYTEIQGVLENPDATPRRLAQTLEVDPAVTGRILSVSNSPTYRGYQENRTLEQAIGRLGLRHTRDLVLAIAARSLFRTDRPDYRRRVEQVWEQSLAMATAGRLLGKRLGVGDADELFTAGLLANIGKLLLLRVFDELALEGQAPPDDEVEPLLEGLHREFGRALFTRWKFSTQFRGIVFDDLESAGGVYRREMLVVNFSQGLVQALPEFGGLSLEELLKTRPATILGIDAALADTLLSETARFLSEARELLAH